MRKVLMVGGDRLQPFREALEQEGYEVSLRAPGDTASPDSPTDVILIDLSAGAEAAEAKRFLQFGGRGEGPPVIALAEPEGLSSLDPGLGWDDFLMSTATPQELLLRVRQALWRHTGVDAKQVLRYGELEIDLANYTVYLAGKPVELTYKEYELLRFLASSADRVFSRESLLNKVWGYDFYGGARTVDVHIRRLRSKIEDHQRTFIETVRNVGYRFRAKP